ncbi:MAG: efflux transporter outer membrane subunit [Candidatus Krumholzibacteria bacterium]|nr:efflux transporter outer membrane subunit [Candidatus Krumholzibacteria bacterium]
MRRFLILVIAAVVAGCTMGPDYKRPVVPEPEEYREEFPPEENIANVPWWELFGDSVLTALIDSALVSNRDLRGSVARISEARAALGIVRSQLFPRLDYAADGMYGGTLGEDGEAEGSGGAFLAASWQIDLWGRIRRTKEAALQELLATEEAYRGVTISLVAEVASSYLLLRDLDNRLDISERTLDVWKQRLEVVQTRFDAGMVTEVDLNQAQIQVFEAEVQVQTFERLRAQTENAISVLMGQPPDAIERGLSLQDQVYPPDIPTGLPSELLQRRPDILEAERQLHAQTARIGAAKALRFPQFNLNADLGAQFADQTTGIFGLGAQLFGPIYNAGEISNQIEVEIARTEQLLNRYEQTILNAYREVDDALVAVRTYRAEFDARRRQMEAAQNASELSWVRYDGGRTNYLEVLDLQRSLFSSQLKASETMQLQLTSIVRLYQALGGGWVTEQDSTSVSAGMSEEE